MRIIQKPTEKGQAIVLMALGMIGMVMITALAIDGGQALANRRQAQNAADTAAFAAALAKVDGKSNWRTVGLARAASNGFTDPQNNPNVNSPATQIDVIIVSPPLDGVYKGNSEYVQVTIRSASKTFFASVVGVSHTRSTTRAVVRAKPGVTGAMYDGAAVVSLAPSGDGTVVSGGGNTTITGGKGIFVNSRNQGFVQTGNSGTLTVTGDIYLVGGATYQFPAKIIAAFRTGASQIPFPPAYSPPAPTCNTNGQLIEVTKNSLYRATPGNWTSFPPSTSGSAPTIVMETGVYCITNSLSVQGNVNIDGTAGVMFYMTPTSSGGFNFSGGGALRLHAPKSGTYQNLLIYVDPKGYPSSKPSCTINGNSGSEWVGTIFAPNCDMKINGTGDTEGLKSQIIGYTVAFGGSQGTKILYMPSLNFNAAAPPTLELSE